MITLTLLVLGALAWLAHRASRTDAPAPRALEAALTSRWIVGAVFVATFCLLWLQWGMWAAPPVVHDELAYVLQARIFAHGRWANPAPPLPAFFEQPHVLVEPRVAAKYFPGHSLLLALGALVGWLPLAPLLLQATVGALTFVLGRRLAPAWVALLAWSIWMLDPLVLYFGPSYFSESTTTAAWLAGWYALLQWRTTRRLPWLLALAFFTGWGAITRPLTGLAYALPVAIVVLRDVVRQHRWRDLALAFVVGSAVIGILPLWSARTTGDWRVTPLARYTRDYMPYDLPGFGFDSTPPRRTLSRELTRINIIYGSFHRRHRPELLPAIAARRARELAVAVWGATRGIVGLFALLGLVTLGAEGAFAVATGVVLFVFYLSYATPAQWTLYYYETTPVLAYLTAAGIAWACALTRRGGSLRREWRSPRYAGILALAAPLLALPQIGMFNYLRLQHIEAAELRDDWTRRVAEIPAARAVLFVRYRYTHNPHVAWVVNPDDPPSARVWTVFDRGPAENRRLLARIPDRAPYMFDEVVGRVRPFDPRTD